MYRSPSQDQQEFEDFMNNFELMISKMSDEEPCAIIITGDFNCRSPQWWEGENENDEGKQFEPIMSDLGLHQLISGPTHMIGQSKSCIDLIITNQPNLFIELGIHPSLHEQCHHQIIHGKLSARNLAPPLILANYGFMIGLIFYLYGKVSKCIISERLWGGNPSR